MIRTDNERIHFTAEDKPKECCACEWGSVEPFEGLSGLTRYGVSCFIPDLEKLQGKCPMRINSDGIRLRVYEIPARRFRAVQHARRLTVRAAASGAGIEITKFSSIINGRTKPSGAEFASLCRFLDLSERESELIALEYREIDRFLLGFSKNLKAGIQEVSYDI